MYWLTSCACWQTSSEQELDENEAYINGVRDEMLLELRAERAAATGAAVASSGGGPKKPTHKQQKRRAAQRRKAEARAAAEAEARAAMGVEEEESKLAGAVATQLRIDELEPNPEPEPDEPEECAICLGDLPAAGDDGDDESAALLQCTHTFHADCLQRWKDKCLEKGLPYTCAMCRGAAVVVAGP